IGGVALANAKSEEWRTAAAGTARGLDGSGQAVYAEAMRRGFGEQGALQIAQSGVMAGANQAQWDSFASTAHKNLAGGLTGELQRRQGMGWTAWGEQGMTAAPVVASPAAGAAGPGGAVTAEGLPGAPAAAGGQAAVTTAPVTQNTFQFPGMSVTVNGDLSEEQKQRLGEEVGTLVVTAIKDAAAAARP
ncbi:MAG TPA: hypothetical protein VF076_04805, partial [Acidimicrobiales bacterium]